MALDRLGQEVVQLRGLAGRQVRELRRRGPHDLAEALLEGGALRCERDAAGPAVVGDGDALDVTEDLEAVDDAGG